MKPAINPTYPIREVRSVDELMAIAFGMEDEAARRYGQLAAEMARRHEPELAALFARLGELERVHEAGLGRWAAREGWPVPLPASFAWRMPETFGDETAGGDAHLLTPYKALALAVTNEEHAFAFYAYLAAMAEDPDIRSHAEALAREELAHVAELRAMRRVAYHRERGAAATARLPRDGGELDAMVRALDEGSATVEAAAAAALEAAGQAQAAFLLRQHAEAVWRRLDGATALGRWSATAEQARAVGLLEPRALTPFNGLKLALRDAEEVLELLMATAENATDEAMMRHAQELAQATIARLAIIGTLIGAQEGADP